MVSDVKYCQLFSIGLLTFQLINLFGNIVRLIPEWQYFADIIFYGLFTLSVLIIIVISCLLSLKKIDLAKYLLIFIGAIGITVFYCIAFDLASLDVGMKNYVDSLPK